MVFSRAQWRVNIADSEHSIHEFSTQIVLFFDGEIQKPECLLFEFRPMRFEMLTNRHCQSRPLFQV
ncbi:unnamed protein product [Nesidiocoris tenuis]|uniref:Uncharacterized protein n=1 Tax=Nesidiocoris tenuis TaxID=355587 RepID=A0A6H5GZE4_9HEMI|nr:unnamed protein product [Nesidiocoris tenuis]